MSFIFGALMLFVLNDSKLKDVKHTSFKNEKELQSFVEDHMKDLMGLRFLATESIIDEHNRVDSVGSDEESSSFVLIEDKNVKDGVWSIRVSSIRPLLVMLHFPEFFEVFLRIDP